MPRMRKKNRQIGTLKLLVNTIINMLKNPPKIGRNYCNSICHRFSTPKPRTGSRSKTEGDPYETHSYCRKCGGIWLPKDVIVRGIYCPCCHIRVANKSRSSKAKAREKLVYY